jgi:hypothetical protein
VKAFQYHPHTLVSSLAHNINKQHCLTTIVKNTFDTSRSNYLTLISLFNREGSQRDQHVVLITTIFLSKTLRIRFREKIFLMILEDQICIECIFKIWKNDMYILAQNTSYFTNFLFEFFLYINKMTIPLKIQIQLQYLIFELKQKWSI